MESTTKKRKASSDDLDSTNNDKPQSSHVSVTHASATRVGGKKGSDRPISQPKKKKRKIIVSTDAGHETQQTSMNTPMTIPPTPITFATSEDGRILDPSKYPTTINHAFTTKPNYQILCQWVNNYNFCFRECTHLWVASGFVNGQKDNKKDPKTSISFQILNRHFWSNQDKYYKELGRPPPKIKRNFNGRKPGTANAPVMEVQEGGEELEIGEHVQENAQENAPDDIQEETQEGSQQEVLIDNKVGDSMSQEVQDPTHEVSEETNEESLAHITAEQDEARFWANRVAGPIKWYFRSDDGKTVSDHNPPLIDAAAATKFSIVMRDLLQDDPNLDVVIAGLHITKLALERYIQCISPELRSSLPTHDMTISADNPDIVERKEIEWIAQALFDVYFIALELKSPHVQDMITDYFWDVFKAGENVDINTDFINKLAEKRDFPALRFWIDIIRQAEVVDLEGFSEEVEELVSGRKKMMKPPVLKAEHQDPFCRPFHHHGAGACYKDVIKEQNDCEKRIQMAEWAVVLGLDDDISESQKKLKDAQRRKDHQAEVEAKACIQRTNEVLRDACENHSLEEFLKSDAFVAPGKQLDTGEKMARWKLAIRYRAAKLLSNW